MTNLTDLSEQALASLLDLPLDKAREWLKIASSVSEEPLWLQDGFDELEASVFLRRSSVRKLLKLSVEDIQRMKRTGELYRRFPYLKPRTPKDAEPRLKYLRELLRYEPEFAARYPAAYETLFKASRSGSGLLLPSFGVRILENAPQESIVPAGSFQEWKVSQDSGDAFSATFEKYFIGADEVDQEFAPTGLGYMRGLLLAVLSREEYAERIATDIHNEAVREEVRAPAQSQIRITDLRLATSPELEHPDHLKRTLKALLESLEKPITPHGVLQWKWATLWEEADARGRRTEDKDAKIVRVSFAAAALLLFLDYDMLGLEHASPSSLARQIGELADIIRKSSKSLNANARKLEVLLAYRDPNRPSKSSQESYKALVAHRMGEDAAEVARRVGINPYKSSPSKPGKDFGGTKEWRSRLEEKLRRGAAIEKEKYPHAASVFENRHKARIKRKARLAYRAYQEETWLRPIEEYSPWVKVGHRIHVNISHDPGFELVDAYIQLGSCLTRNLNPFPTLSDFGA